MLWRTRHFSFDLDERPLVMGILNVTPDSFWDGARYRAPAAAIEHGLAMLEQGADLIDVGGESTRPGSEPVPAREQIGRLLPVLEPLAKQGAILSVDTSSAEVAYAALDSGAVVVNDVTGLGDPLMAKLVVAGGAGLVLMHMRGTPATMQQEPLYDDVTRDVASWLDRRLADAERQGIPPERIVLDPGIGFGKTAAHNFELLARLEELLPIGRPLLVGLSRKSFLGRAQNLPVEERLEGGLAATAVAVFLGARVFRTHDVVATKRAVTIGEALRVSRRAAAPGPR